MALSVLFVSVLIFGLVGNGTAGDPRSAYYDQASDRLFWFVQASDVHIGASGTQDSGNLSWLVNQARQAIEPSFIIVTGDLTDSTNGNILGWPNGPYQAEWDEYKSIVDIPGITPDNYYDIPGNHDAYNDQFFAYYLANSVQGRATGNTQASFTREFNFGKYHFLGINTAGNTGEGFSISPPYGDPAGLDNDELSFISDAMAQNTDSDLTMVFGHHPLFDTGNSTDTYVYYGLEEFLGLMNQSYASLYGYGHTHAFEEAFFVPNNSQHDGFFYFNVDSLGKSSENQYTIMAIDCNGFSSKTLDVGNWPAILITAPLDDYLGGYNPYSYPVPASPSNPIRALVFDPGTVLSVQYRIDGSSTWHDMFPVDGNQHLWEASWDSASLSQAQHTIEVAASSGLGSSSDLITVSVDQGSQQSLIGAAFKEQGIGTYMAIGGREEQTTVFIPNNDANPAFQLGDAVVFRLTAMDEVGLGIQNATVQITISGPERHELSGALSDSEGNVEAVWQTSAPTQTGQGGTAEGTYTATITDVTAAGFSWDGQIQTKAFRLNSHVATKSSRSITRSRSVSR